MGSIKNCGKFVLVVNVVTIKNIMFSAVGNFYPVSGDW